MAKQAQMERLNRLGEQWPALRDSGDPNQKLSAQSEIFELIFQLFTAKVDALTPFFERDWPHFDPQKGSLEQFCATRLKLRLQDETLWEQGWRRRQITDQKTREKTRQWVQNQSLQQTVDEQGETTRQDLLASEERYATDAAALCDGCMLQLLTLMLDLPQKLHGRANNPQRLNYFRMFFTDSIVDIVHTMEAPTTLRERERDLFSVLQLSFQDFFLTTVCRTTEELCRSRNRPYGQMVPGRPMEEPDHPLPNDVYCAYLEQETGSRVGDSAISNQRTAYKQLLKGFLC